jgi:hypothetical protein
MIDAAIDSGSGAPSDVYPAFHPTVPQVTSRHGRVLASPRIVEIFYADDPEIAQLEDFTTKLAASTEWTAMVQEYGVGAPTIATPVVLAQNAPATLTDTEVRAMLESSLDGTHPEYGAVDGPTLLSTIYVLHMPLGVAYTSGTAKGCVVFAGYHASLSVGSNPTQFAIINSCPPPPQTPTTLDLDTATLSHELVETVSDPEPFSGFAVVNPPSTHWVLEFGSELGDMCELATTSWVKPADLGYYIQRGWSNAAAAGYHDYCVPAPPAETVYFAAAPVATDSFLGMVGANSVALNGTLAHVGQPTTIAVELFSDGTTGGAWGLESLDDVAWYSNNTTPPVLDLQLDRPFGQNGEIVHLTITPRSMPASGYAIYTLRSTLGAVHTYWKGVVGISP